MNQQISIIIPCFNSASLIRKTAKTVLQAFPDSAEVELILVDDGSSDETWKEILALARDFKEVRGIALDRNHGEHRALYAGIREARGKYIFTMDDDLQHNPNDIPLLHKELLSGVELVYGQYHKYNHGFLRKICSAVNGWTASLLIRRPAGLHLSSLRGFYRDVLDDLEEYSNRSFYLDAFLLARAQRIGTVPISHRITQLPSSRYNFKRLFKLYAETIRSALQYESDTESEIFEIRHRTSDTNA